VTTVVVLFNLKPGVDAGEYERWARAHDLPEVTGLASVRQFRVLRALGLMNGTAAPYRYIELIEIYALEGFRLDVKSDAMQRVAQQFRQFADSPVFIVTESIQ
jgi:hypothetical protein